MSLSLTELRQSAAELLACAVLDLFPGAHLVDSSTTEFGFYYDFIASQPIDEHALVFLEEKIRGLIKQNHEVRSLDMMRENAAAFFEHKGQPYLAQKVLDARENIVSVFQMGEFHDFCPSPYVQSSQEVGAVKILKVEPATHYFLDEGHQPVIRIRGTAFPDTYSLKKFLKTLPASRKKDHRILGQNLFAFYPQISELDAFWQNNGVILRETIANWWRQEHQQQNFTPVVSPPLIKDELFEKIGFYDRVDPCQYPPISQIEGVDYVVPPSLTPVHAQIFASKNPDRRDFPVRYAECAWIANSDKKKQLWGMLNTPLAYVDIAHIFCSPKEVEKELISSLQFIDKITKIFSFEYHWCVKGRGSKFAGSTSRWEKSLESLIAAFNNCGYSYTLDETETSFHGPVAQTCIIDSLGREWKGPYVGFDFNCPERLQIRYQDTDNKSYTPLLLVRSLLGSIERFCAILVEHYAGLFPLWLAPEQVRVLPVRAEDMPYANKVYAALKAAGYRAHLDSGPKHVNAKIQAAENEKIPYTVVVGEKEEKQQLITVRSAYQQMAQEVMTFDAFLFKMQNEVSNKCHPHA